MDEHQVRQLIREVVTEVLHQQEQQRMREYVAQVKTDVLRMRPGPHTVDAAADLLAIARGESPRNERT